MGYSVSSWFVDQLQAKFTSPKRVLTLGGSDYSPRVAKWPVIRRHSSLVKSVNLTVPLANDDGGMNYFYEQVYAIPKTLTLDFGYTHPTSGDELITLYTGQLKNVKYSQNKLNLIVKDKFDEFVKRKVGDSDAVVTFSHEIPSEIAWVLVTSYGQLDSTTSTSNVDINYSSFLTWAEQFSTNAVIASARYDGNKVSNAIKSLGSMMDSAIYIEGDGKLRFEKFVEPNSLDSVINENQIFDLLISVDTKRVINKHWVYWDYAQESDYWQNKVFAIDSVSVDSFGLQEEIAKDENIWFVDSISALNLAQRKVSLLKQPPKSFEVKTGVVTLHRQLGETLKIVDSFYNITSGSGWRFIEEQIDMDKGKVGYFLDEATVQNAFYLDVSTLDMDDYLL